MKSRKDFESDEEYNRYLRMCIAMAAMQGIIANDGGGPPDVAHRAVVMADELLKALES